MAPTRPGSDGVADHDIQLLQRLRYALSARPLSPPSTSTHEKTVWAPNASVSQRLHEIDSTTYVRYACLVLGGSLVGLAAVLPQLPLTITFLGFIVGGVVGAVFAVIRHFQIVRGHLSTQAQTWISTNIVTAPDLNRLDGVHILYILGSGGHTTEMIALIRRSLKVSSNLHRRYIVNQGDKHSENQVLSLERKIAAAYPGDTSGTYDALLVTRARAIHQSYLTSIFTSLKCAIEILMALVTVPKARAGHPATVAFQFPSIIVTNGPGTGFIVALVAHILKVFYVAPQNKMQIIFFETWARTHSLGLTGKLFWQTGIADLFVVQSEALAKAVGKPNIGNVCFADK